MTTPHASAPQPPADRAEPSTSVAPPAPSAPPAPFAPTAPGARPAAGGAVRVACGAEIRLHLVTGRGGEIPFPAQLSYTRADPYAVRLHCRTGPATSVTWVLSRDTLCQGLARRSGLGDVHVRPDPEPGPEPEPDRPDSVLITLGSGPDAALLRGDAREIQRFLSLSASVVAPGTEHRHLDLDALIYRLRTEP